ncbi:hypothetical protein [Larkinella harenae]
MEKQHEEESITRLRSEILTLQTAISKMEQSTYFQSAFCVLDTLQAHRKQLTNLKNRRRICQENLQDLLLKA